MIENAPPKQGHKEILGIDRLVTKLTKMPEIETQRLKKDKVDALMRQMVNEIPYAYQVITPTLAESLLADTPQKTSELKLNEVLTNLGLSLFEPAQKDKVITEVQLYLSGRKATEREYAAALMPEILNTADLKNFPEKAQQELIKLALLVLEKVINEKQLRMTPGYRLESLITIVEPFLYHRLFDIEMERLRASHHLIFRKFINAIAQDGYEKINDQKKLLEIQKQKQTAFNQFADAMKRMAIMYPALETAHNHLHYLQKDRLMKQAEMKKLLDGFPDAAKPKTIGGMIAHHLRLRVNEKLRRAFIATESDPKIYTNEFTIKQAHDEIYSVIKNDVYALKFLIENTQSIRTQFHKKFLQIFSQMKALKTIDTMLMDNILGEAVTRVSFITKDKLVMRDGGYPKRTVKQIYTDISVSLAALEQNVKGLFAGKLKAELTRVLSELRKASLKLSEGTLKEPEAAKVAALPEVTAVLEELKAAPAKPAPETEEKVVEAEVVTPPPQPVAAEKVATPPPLPVVEKEVAAAPPSPPVVEEKVVTPPPLVVEKAEVPPPASAPVVEEKVVTPPPQPVVEEKVLEEKPVTPPPLIATEEKVAAKPLLPVEEEPAPAPEPAPKVETKPLIIPTEEVEEPVQFEKVTPKPLLAEDTFAEPAQPAAAKATAETQDHGTQEALDSGAVIMKNYQLGDFEKPIYEAWKTMVTSSGEQETTMGGGLIPLHSDNDVKLYVICDLAQQVSSVKASQLSDEQKQILQNIKTQLLTALKNPLDDENWDYFEGSHRDIIDGQLGAIM